MNRLSELFAKHVQFSYTAPDRIVLNGYIERLQRPENLVHFFHEVVGVPCIEPPVLADRTKSYRSWVSSYAEAEGIPLLAAVKGESKEELVLPYYRRLHGHEGVACILTSIETGRSFVSYTPRFPPKSGDSNYRRISACRKQFLHYYFYIQDPVMGPMSLRAATYLPFNITCYLNGHSFLAQELTSLGVPFQKEDNAILAVADHDALKAAAGRLSPALLRQRCSYWTDQLLPVFSKQEREEFDLSYRYSVAQIELATDVIFKRRLPLRALFQRAAEIGVLLGGADRTVHIFGRRITRRYQGKLETVLDRRNQGQPVLRSYYQTSFVKQYEKGDRLLRTETCINNTYHLGIGRRLENLPALVEHMAGTNQRYLDLQTELLDSTVDTGALAALAQPTFLGKRRIPGIKLQDDRLIRLMEILLHPSGLLAAWTTRDVHSRLLQRCQVNEQSYRLAQLRYDLSKLRAKGLVERIGRTRCYRLTALGLKLCALLVKLRTRLLGPLCTALSEPPRPRSRHPSAVEAGFRNVQAALDQLCQALGLVAA